MNILLGVGNELNGDDGIGVYIAKNFKCKNWKTINCATVPENFIGKIKRYNPEKIVIVDAADMGLKAGEIRKIKKEEIGKVSFSTHSIPLSLFISHLERYTKAKIYLIGIQPKSFYGEMSKEVKNAGTKIMKILEKDEIDKIKELR